MEQWKHYRDNYFVSNMGRVFNSKYNRMLTGSQNHQGYVLITIRGSKRETCKLHRLVAMLFIDNPDNKETVNHINGIKVDNRVENLEWSSRKEQVDHLYENNLKKTKPVNQYDKNGLYIKTFKNVTEAAKAVGGHSTNIYNAANGKQKTSYGYVWKY